MYKPFAGAEEKRRDPNQGTPLPEKGEGFFTGVIEPGDAANPLFWNTPYPSERGMLQAARPMFGWGPHAGIAGEQNLTGPQRAKLGTPQSDMFRKLVLGSVGPSNPWGGQDKEEQGYG
jgi:hypothetical protein